VVLSILLLVTIGVVGIHWLCTRNSSNNSKVQAILGQRRSVKDVEKIIQSGGAQDFADAIFPGMEDNEETLERVEKINFEQTQNAFATGQKFLIYYLLLLIFLLLIYFTSSTIETIKIMQYLI